MKKKHRDALNDIRNIVTDMETCLRTLDAHARRVLGRFADIPLEDWEYHIRTEEQQRTAAQSGPAKARAKAVKKQRRPYFERGKA